MIHEIVKINDQKCMCVAQKIYLRSTKYHMRSIKICARSNEIYVRSTINTCVAQKYVRVTQQICA